MKILLNIPKVDGEIVKEENNFIYRYEFLDVKALANQNKINFAYHKLYFTYKKNFCRF